MTPDTASETSQSSFRGGRGPGRGRGGRIGSGGAGFTPSSCSGRPAGIAGVLGAPAGVDGNFSGGRKRGKKT